MILTREVILEELRKGRIKIEPFNRRQLGPTSYDLTLSNELRIFKSGYIEVDTADIVRKFEKLEEITKRIIIDDFYPLKPYELVLGITKEKITLPSDICGWLEGRSRFARFGLIVHATASFLHPGISNRQVFEIFNMGKHVIKLRAGICVAQIIFGRCEGKASYKGIFRTQMEV